MNPLFRPLAAMVAILALAAALPVLPAAAATNLGGEELTASSAQLTPEATGGDPYCGATQQGSVTYSTSGTAAGPFPGTFTETGQWSFDLINEQTYHAKFKITSGGRTLSGVVLWDVSAVGAEGTSLIANYGSCSSSRSGGAYSLCENEALTSACGDQSIAYIGAGAFMQTFVGTPKITALSPAAAITGATVLITGTGLNNATTVKFGARAAAFTVLSPTEIEATVPAGATAGKVAVANPSGTAKSPGVFTPTLSITALSSASGRPGKVVSVKGVGFNATSTVSFGGTPAAVTFVSAAELRAVVPSGSGTAPVTVTNIAAPVGTVESPGGFTIL